MLQLHLNQSLPELPAAQACYHARLSSLLTTSRPSRRVQAVRVLLALTVAMLKPAQSVCSVGSGSTPPSQHHQHSVLLQSRALESPPSSNSRSRLLLMQATMPCAICLAKHAVPPTR
eukprot:336558-Rhodomonas_salina.1